MIKIEFTEEEMQALDYERYHHPRPQVKRKMEALLLKSKGLSHNEICRVAGITAKTLRTYLREYQQGGIEALKQIKRSENRLGCSSSPWGLLCARWARFLQKRTRRRRRAS